MAKPLQLGRSLFCWATYVSEIAAPEGVGRPQITVADNHNSYLAKAREAVKLAQRRRNEQALIVAGLTDPEERAWAEQILRHRDVTLQLLFLGCIMLEFTPLPSNDNAIETTYDEDGLSVWLGSDLHT